MHMHLVHDMQEQKKRNSVPSENGGQRDKREEGECEQPPPETARDVPAMLSSLHPSCFPVGTGAAWRRASSAQPVRQSSSATCVRRKFNLKWDLFEKLVLKDTDRWGKTKREDSSKRHFFPMEKITQYIHSRKNWTTREKVRRAIDCILQRTNKKKEHKIILPSNTLWAEIGRERHKMHHRRFSPFSPKDILSSAYCVAAQMQMCTCVWLRRAKVCPRCIGCYPYLK